MISAGALRRASACYSGKLEWNGKILRHYARSTEVPSIEKLQPGTSASFIVGAVGIACLTGASCGLQIGSLLIWYYSSSLVFTAF